MTRRNRKSFTANFNLDDEFEALCADELDNLPVSFKNWIVGWLRASVPRVRERECPARHEIPEWKRCAVAEYHTMRIRPPAYYIIPPPHRAQGKRYKVLHVSKLPPEKQYNDYRYRIDCEFRRKHRSFKVYADTLLELGS